MKRRDQLIDIAKTYLYEGLLEHKPSEVLFHENCVRMEMGFETGRGATQLRELLLDESYHANESISDLQWVVEEPYVDVRYLLKCRNLPLVISVATRFEILDETIVRIDILLDAGAAHSAIIESIQALRTDF